MAKAKEIIGLDCAADALEQASAVLRARFEEIAERRAAALEAADVEGVHAMRVATRRLRSALRDFAPLMRRRPLRRVKKDLKRFADALGAARDEDVAIVALEKLQERGDGEEVRAGVGLLLAERRAARARAQTDLEEILSGPAVEDLGEKFAAALATAAARKKSARAVSFSEAGREAVAAGLREFLALSENLYAPSAEEGLHELRIAAKRLRYAVELFAACWGERAAPFAAEIAEMQTFLGEVHDADVWIAGLGKRLRGRAGAAAAADLWLLSEFVKERAKNYREALGLWGRWQAGDFAGRLKAAIAQAGP